MNIYNDQRLASFSALNGFTGLCLGEKGFNVVAGVSLLSGAALGGSYWVVNSFIGSRLLNLMQNRVASSLAEFPEVNSERFVFIAAHVADFAAKAFVAWAALCCLGAAVPLSSAMITLGVSQLLYLFFRNLPYKDKAMALFVETPIVRVVDHFIETVEVLAEEVVGDVQTTAEYVYSYIPLASVQSCVPNSQRTEQGDLPVAEMVPY